MDIKKTILKHWMKQEVVKNYGIYKMGLPYVRVATDLQTTMRINKVSYG